MNVDVPYCRVVYTANGNDEWGPVNSGKLHNDGHGVDERPTDRNDNDQDDDHDHTDEDNMVEVSVANEIKEEADMVGLKEE